MNNQQRCNWPGEDPLYVDYHDHEWGLPVFDDKALFEKLILDGFQAGLSWITILRKRNHFIEVFNGFEPTIIASYSSQKIEVLMNDPGIIRNRLKIQNTVACAKAWIKLRETGQSFSDFLWQFVEGETIHNSWKNMKELPAETNQSKAMSTALKKAGFGFCGPTICYAFMQAVGMVNDHTTNCFRHSELQKRN